MVEDEGKTMRELFEEHDYDTDELVHPRDVDADMIDEETTVVAYTVVRNPDPDAPATTYDIVEYDINAVVPSDEMYEHTDGAVDYPDDTPITHGVIWAYSSPGNIPQVQSIGYGEELYGDDSDFDDPQRWDRLVTHVRGRSDDFVRFRL